MTTRRTQPTSGYRSYELRYPQQRGTLERYIAQDQETAIVKLPPTGPTMVADYAVYVQGRYVRTYRTLDEAEATIRRAAAATAGLTPSPAAGRSSCRASERSWLIGGAT